ncbi:MAG: hypothetical protein JO202_18445 [Ktedonobacteraceae bacterium]|nr:hypothetical protein [Ktedonobacteraceae bacterium]
MQQYFTSLDTRLSTLEQRVDFQTSELKAKFETSDMYAGKTWGVVYGQQGDIREVKQDIKGITGRLDDIDARFDRVEGRFDAQEEKLTQILERLPKQGG